MSNHANSSSPDVLFEMPSTSSPDVSFSTPLATSTNLASEANTDVSVVDTKELEGLRTVNITPTGDESTQHINGKITASPPLVLKSVPTTPLTTNFDQDGNESTQISTGLLDEMNLTRRTDMDDEDDPRELVISSLRTQISDLFSQVALLNSKLVQSYDRVSSLEETLDENTEKLRALEGERMNLENEKNALELERSKHGEMLRDGRLVERSAVAAELNRLMEESLESSNARKTAEAKHAQIESELSDLSANLFSTANEMVAKERQARAAVEESLSKSRAEYTRLSNEIKSLEVRLAENGRTVEILQEERAVREGEVQELRQVVRSIDLSNVNTASGGVGGIMRMMNSHAPYKIDYLGFISHLRKLLPTTPNPPPITSVLSLPFLQRLAVEDSEPTLRLDLAPSLNWLTRRSVLGAIHSNTLLIEQIHVATLFLENSAVAYSYSPFASGNSLPTSPTQLTKVVCALCGKVVYMSPEAIQAEQNQYQSLVLTPTTPTPTSSQPPQTGSPQRSNSGGGGWGAAKFLKSVNIPSLGGGGSASGTSTPTLRNSLEAPPVVNGISEGLPFDRPPSPPPATSLQTVIHAFRVPVQSRSNSIPTGTLTSNAGDNAGEYGPPYPLCPSGWCLARLKTTCELWGFVGHDIIERVWREARSIDLREKMDNVGRGSNELTVDDELRKEGTPPPVPAKKKVPTLWGMGREYLDKLGGSPGSAGEGSPVVTPSSIFNNVRRTFSGSTPAPAPSDSSRASSFDGKTALSDSASEVTTDASPSTLNDATIRAPPLPPRGISRLSAVFTGSIDNTTATTEKNTVKESVPEEIIAETSPSAGTFATPAGTPAHEKGLILEKEGEAKTQDVPVVLEHPADSNGPTLSAEAATAVEVEPPTPTPANTRFSSDGKATEEEKIDGKRPGHQRTTSTLSITSDAAGASTPRPPLSRRTSGIPATGSRPSTPTRLPTSTSRPSTPNKGTTGSRPSTPTKLPARAGTPTKPGVAPPPVPRRAAARNAARGSLGGKKELDEKRVAEEKAVAGAVEEAKEVKEVEPKVEVSVETPAPAPADQDIAPEPSASGPIEAVPISTSEATKEEAVIVASEDPQDKTEAIPEIPNKDVPTPKSIPAALPSPPLLSPPHHPLPGLPSSMDTEVVIGGSRPRQASVSSASVYSPSIYTTNSNMATPAGLEGDGKLREKGNEDMRFYVGRGTWEERAWLELVRIRESMFWARLGGVRH